MSAEIVPFELFSPIDRLRLSGLCALPQGQPVGIVQLVHGMSEHKERYLPLMRFLTSLGYCCYIHDHRGHGASVRAPEDLGYFYRGGAHALVEDTFEVTQLAKRQHPALPYFLLGHSMGSLVVRAYLKRHDGQLDGLIVCGCPSNNPAAGLGKVLARTLALLWGGRHISHLLQAMAFGSFNRRFEPACSPNAWVCSDEAVVQAYDQDPLCGFPFTLDGFTALFELVQAVYDPSGWQLARRSLPIHFISGAEDPCLIGRKQFVAALGTLQLAGYERVSYRLYPEMRHEILNERHREQVFEDLARTLAAWRAAISPSA